MNSDSLESKKVSKVYVSPAGETIPRIWANVKNGKIPWTELDEEELGRGQMRDVNGGFSGRPPDLVPRDMVGEVKRRLAEVYHEKFQQRVLDAQAVLFDIMMDDTNTPTDRFKAAVYIQERMFGKVPDKVEITAEVKPWEGMVAGVLEDVDDQVT